MMIAVCGLLVDCGDDGGPAAGDAQVSPRIDRGIDHRLDDAGPAAEAAPERDGPLGDSDAQRDAGLDDAALDAAGSDDGAGINSDGVPEGGASPDLDSSPDASPDASPDLDSSPDANPDAALKSGWWTLPSSGAPTARFGHSAVWTGKEMIVWGGTSVSSSYFYEKNDGARFDPATGKWSTLPSGGAPAARFGHSAVWTGKEMIIWGGTSVSSSYFYEKNDGARFDPATNKWSTLPSSGAPAARFGHSAVWTGGEMIVWGGTTTSSSYFYEKNDGGRFDPAAGKWSTLSSTGAPAARFAHSAVWTGSEMIIWGGTTVSSSYYYEKNDGARFDPAGSKWWGIPQPSSNSSRFGHSAVWTGSEMIIWGGTTVSSSYFYEKDTGGRFVP
jgi:hypothetical protein